MILHLSTPKKLILVLCKKQADLHLKLDSKFEGSVYETYKGDYIINPKVTSQGIECKDKLMVDDVTINAIYYNETENQSGGMTAQIGEI